MSSNKSNNSVHSYLNSASLFRNKKKNLYNSSYVTHNRYFDDQYRPSSITSNSTAIKMPNVTNSKKQTHFQHEIDKEKDYLRISEQLSSREEEQIFQKQLQIFGSILASKETEKPKMPTKKSEEKPLEQRSDKQQKIDDNILSDSLRGSKKEVSKDSNKFVPLNKSDKETKQILNKSNKSMKVIIKTASNHVKQEVQEKSFCQKIQIGSEQKDQFDGKKFSDYINPYEPKSVYRKRQVEDNEEHQLTMKKMAYQQSHTISSIEPTKNPREDIYTTNNSGNNKQEGYQSQNNLHNVRKEISCYLNSLKVKLQGSLICLQTLEGQFDIIMDKTLQLQSERLKAYLFKLVEEQISSLKEFQKRQMLKNKFYFMSQLYQMKCNIQLRSQQIQNLQSIIKDDYRWKESIHSVISNSYTQGINSIITKSQQIQSELTAELDINLVHFTQKANKQLLTSLKSTISDQFYKHRQLINRSKEKDNLVKEKE